MSYTLPGTDLTADLLSTPEEFVEHERCLFKAFSSEPWSMNYCTLIDGDRLQHPIPYSSQLVYGVRHKGVLVSGICVNFGRDRLMLEDVGFKLTSEQRAENFLDGLYLYSLKVPGVNPLDIGACWNGYVFRELAERGYTCLYDTCNARMGTFFKFQGWEELAELTGDDPEFLMVKRL